MYRAVGTILLALAPAPRCVTAQGIVRGTVHDGAGTAIGGAIVNVRGTTLSARTDDRGEFRIAMVRAGQVALRAAAIGHTAVDTTVALTGGDSTTVDFTLVAQPLALDPVDVVSSRIPYFGERPATSVADVTTQDLERRAVNTADEAIDHVAGVQMINGQTNIRGSTGYVQGLNSRVLMTIDGVPMNQGDRGGISWDILNVDDIESVEILKGAGSSLYGSAAFGGVINMTTRDIPSGTHTRLRLTGGMYDDPPHAVWRFRDDPGLLGGADVAASYGSDEIAARISGGDRHSDGYRQQDQDDHLHVAGKARWKTQNMRVDLSGAWAVDRYDVPLTWCSRGECDDRGQVFQPFMVDTTERGARTDSRKGYLAAQARMTVTPQFAWSARGSWLRTNFTDVRRSAAEYGNGDRFGLGGQIESRPDTTRAVVVGLEATLSDVASDIFGNHSQSEFAAYGQSEQRVGAARISGGARVDFLAIDGGSLTAVVSPRVAVSIPSDRLGSPQGTLRASIGRGFRAPTMAERFVRTTALGFDVISNPTLEPETAWSFEIGHTSGPLLHLMRVDAALFWTEARDLIEPRAITNPNPPPTIIIQLQNIVRARIRGLDASITAAPIRGRLVTTLGYSYLDTRRQLVGDSLSGPLAFRPKHLVTATADYSLATVGVGADFRYASRVERIELEGFVDPRRVAMQVLDMRANWRRGPVAFRLLAANVLNYIYNLVPETLAPVRTVTLTAVWSH
ncbi:MAG TPA: TonB-dependent receptor [Gemmatimonadales bacterium]|nr:TonB-dependent receptor [Gemmatimonadales bacterium]